MMYPRGKSGLVIEPMERRLLMAAGSPDPSFGVAGRSFDTSQFGNFYNSAGVIVEPDGSVVALGPNVQTTDGTGGVYETDQLAVRYGAGGTVDATYFANQVPAPPPPGAFPLGLYRTLYAVAADGAGGAYVGGAFGGGLSPAPGSGTGSFTLLHLGKKGRSLGAGGGTFQPEQLLGEFSTIRAIAVQYDGKIVVAGALTGGYGRYDYDVPPGFGFARFNPDLTLDTSFGIKGTVVCGPPRAVINAIAIDANGNIVGAGAAPETGAGTSGVVDAALVRLRPDGRLDSRFGDGGIFTQAISPGAGANPSAAFDGLAVLPNGALAVSGHVGGSRFVFAEYATVLGSPTGPYVVPILVGPGLVTRDGPETGATSLGRSRLAVAPDGKVVVADMAGHTSGTAGNVATYGDLVRYNADETADATFGVAGVQPFNLSQRGAPGDVAVTPDGRIVTTEYASNHVDRFVGRPVTLAADGTLIVSGNAAAADAISVTRDANGMTASADGHARTVAAGDVKRVFVAGGAGDDSIDLSALSSVGATVDGGAGNDTILGSAMSDWIAGGGGDDSLTGGPGADTLRGNTGKDTLDGGAGRDQLFGGAGDDLFFAADGAADTIEGGPGNDTAHADAIDLLTNVETQTA